MSWKSALKPYHLKLHFSNKFSYAQILRGEDGHIVAAASTIEKALRDSLPNTSNKEVRNKIINFEGSQVRSKY
jgi:ribosomal protein L18